MESWAQASRDSYHAAQELLAKGRWRSCVSRCYFAAYSALTGEVQKSRGMRFRRGRNNPSHCQLPELIRAHLHGFGRVTAGEMARIIRELFRARLQADYSPEAHIDKQFAVMSVRQAARILRKTVNEEA